MARLAITILSVLLCVSLTAPVAAQQYQFTSRSSGTVWQATVTDTQVEMSSNGVRGTYYRLNAYDVQGYRIYSNESRTPPVIGIPDSGTGLLLAGTNAFDQSTYRDSDLLISAAPAFAPRTNQPGGTSGSGATSAVPLVGVNSAPPQYKQFSLAGGGYSGTAAQSDMELRISIGSNSAEIYQRSSVYDVPGFQAYQNPTMARIIRWPATGVGTMSIGDISPGGSISWNSSPLQITPVVAAVTPGSGPVLPGPGAPVTGIPVTGPGSAPARIDPGSSDLQRCSPPSAIASGRIGAVE